MDITTTSYKRCDVVKATGRIDSQTAPELKDTFDNLRESNKAGIVFDMEDVDFISSRGIWVLLETQKALRNENRNLVLVNVSEEMSESFELVGVKHFIEIYDDLTAAVGSF